MPLRCPCCGAASETTKDAVTLSSIVLLRAWIEYVEKFSSRDVSFQSPIGDAGTVLYLCMRLDQLSQDLASGGTMPLLKDVRKWSRDLVVSLFASDEFLKNLTLMCKERGKELQRLQRVFRERVTEEALKFCFAVDDDFWSRLWNAAVKQAQARFGVHSSRSECGRR